MSYTQTLIEQREAAIEAERARIAAETKHQKEIERLERAIEQAKTQDALLEANKIEAQAQEKVVALMAENEKIHDAIIAYDLQALIKHYQKASILFAELKELNWKAFKLKRDTNSQSPDLMIKNMKWGSDPYEVLKETFSQVDNPTIARGMAYAVTKNSDVIYCAIEPHNYALEQTKHSMLKHFQKKHRYG